MTGVNAGGDTHVRLYVTLTDSAIDTLKQTEGWSHDHDIFDLHDGYDQSYRQDRPGSSAGLQISYKSKDKTKGDIDIDYRHGLFEGHLKHYNSDVRALGPQKSDGKPIDNYQRFVDRWPGLHQWWQQRTIENSTYEKK